MVHMSHITIIVIARKRMDKYLKKKLISVQIVKTWDFSGTNSHDTRKLLVIKQ